MIRSESRRVERWQSGRRTVGGFSCSLPQLRFNAAGTPLVYKPVKRGGNRSRD